MAKVSQFTNFTILNNGLSAKKFLLLLIIGFNKSCKDCLYAFGFYLLPKNDWNV